MSYDFYKNYKLKVSKEIYVSKGFSGLLNIGNKCYMISILHCLASTFSLTDYFLNGEYKHDTNYKNNGLKLGICYKNLVEQMFSTNQLIKPIEFYKTISSYYPKYYTLEQQDSHEFLLRLLQLLHNSFCYKVNFERKNDLAPLNKLAIDAWESFFKEDYSVITKLFYGNMSTVFRCTSCKNVYTCFQPFNQIIVYPNKKDLTDCLDFKKSIINNKICENCSNESFSMTNMIWTAPKYLIFVIKRFKETLEKNDALVSFPIENLDMTKFIHYEKNFKNHLYLYDLYAINYHSGTINNGHYYSVIKNLITNEWYNYNNGDILKHPSFIVENALVNKDAYILFYHRKFVTRVN
jgi:ubiquitin C-terminal hydrolase